MSLRLALLLTLVLPLWPGVVRVEIQSRGDVLGGRAFGPAGSYEKLIGKVHFAVDPSNPNNQIIADIGLAPKNASGQVEFSADFYLLKPKDLGRGNGAALYEVSNRGNKGMLGMFNRASSSLDPSTEAHFGDGFLLNQGYTLVWLGWQWDPPELPGRMRVYVPQVKGVRGPVRSDFVVTERVTSRLLSDREHLPYLVADPGDPKATLTVRDRVESERRAVPRTEWRFSADRRSIEMPAGFEPNKIYEVVYTSEDPVLVGLGPSAVRDFLSYLKYDAPASPIGRVQRAYGFGVSQSGRFLRTFLYYGFNQDEAGRKVMDGVMAHVAGGGRGSFNHRFAQPSRDAHPFLNQFWPTDIFPFTDVVQTDPETGLSDGLLARARQIPKIFYTNSSYEYWGRAASLIHTTVDGRADAPIPDHTRIYLFAGSQHGPAAFPPGKSIGQQRNNPNDFKWAMRALLSAMDRWVKDGAAPPPSVYPKVAADTLVAPAAVQWPKIPGVGFSTRPHYAYRADYGPQWKQGIVTQEPPKIGKRFPILVSQVDRDGNEVAGLKMPELAVPLATYAGWNLFNGRDGPADEISSMQGSFIPFPATKGDREKTKDPRLSIEERYPNRDDYLGKVSAAARKLVEQGYLLDPDVPGILKQAGERWDWVTTQGR
jgi:hypothetical protein